MAIPVPPTVGEFKLMLNAIPGGAQAAQIVPGATADQLQVVTGWHVVNGDIFFTTIGLLDLINKQYVPLS